MDDCELKNILLQIWQGKLDWKEAHTILAMEAPHIHYPNRLETLLEEVADQETPIDKALKEIREMEVVTDK